jgi:signal transduction histidine kinase
MDVSNRCPARPAAINRVLVSTAAMTVRESSPLLWHGFIDWMKRVPTRAAHDRGNAVTLQAILAVIAAATLVMAIASCMAATDTTGVADNGLILVVSAYAWSCFCLLRYGFFRLSTSLTVIGGLILMGMSYQAYGLRAQSGLQITQLLPLLCSGLFLGRAAAWWTALANAATLAIGAHTDLQLATDSMQASDALTNLLLAGMNFLVLATILDRLILSSQRAINRSEKLNALCLELQHQVQEKERAYERLLQTQKMETIGRLSTGIAHDFNAILSVILGHATSVDRRGGSIDAVLPGIRQAARRGATLTRRLLSFSRTHVREISTFDLAQAIDEVRPLILPMFPRGIEVSLDTSVSGLPISADRDELVLALLNIASNACDAMPQGGRFVLAVEADSDHAFVRLEDTGIGMAPDVLARMFEPFFTTKPKDKGTGIGMATVHRFVTDHGGEIHADSAPGQGTRIRIRLPLAMSGRGYGYAAGDDADREIPRTRTDVDDHGNASPGIVEPTIIGCRIIGS